VHLPANCQSLWVRAKRQQKELGTGTFRRATAKAILFLLAAVGISGATISLHFGTTLLYRDAIARTILAVCASPLSIG
jgi:hypothetical protein